LAFGAAVELVMAMVNTWYLYDFKGLSSARTLSAACRGVKSLEFYAASLEDFGPKPIASVRVISQRQRLNDQRNWTMVTFQLLGMVFMGLFFGALVTGNPSPAR
jgi:hypothetical protein